MSLFDYLFAAIPLLGTLVFVHELGHFLAAKACGVRVLKFSLGFGPPIGLGRFRMRWVRRGTEYVVAWFPLGGFVKMLGEPMPGSEAEPQTVLDAAPDEYLSAKRTWQKLLITFAGPAMNLALPVLAFAVVLWIGVPRPTSVVGMVETGSPAAEAGLEPGDRIVSVDDRPVSWWQDVSGAIAEASGTSPAARGGPSRRVAPLRGTAGAPGRARSLRRRHPDRLDRPGQSAPADPARGALPRRSRGARRSPLGRPRDARGGRAGGGLGAAAGGLRGDPGRIGSRALPGGAPRRRIRDADGAHRRGAGGRLPRPAGGHLGDDPGRSRLVRARPPRRRVCSGAICCWPWTAGRWAASNPSPTPCGRATGARSRSPTRATARRGTSPSSPACARSRGPSTSRACPRTSTRSASATRWRRCPARRPSTASAIRWWRFRAPST